MTAAGVPFTRLVRVELRKAHDTRAGFWILLSTALFVTGMLATATVIAVVRDDPARLADFTTIAAYLTSFLLPLLAIMLVTSEWSQHTALVTFTLEPRRSRVVAAKLVVAQLLTLLALALSLAVGLTCTAICQLVRPDRTSWRLGPTDLAGWLVTQTLTMLGGFALAVLILHTSGAVLAFVAYKYVLPVGFAAASALVDGFDRVGPWLDFQGAQTDLYDWTLSGAPAWWHLLVSGLLWLALPLAAGLHRVLRAEIT